MADEVDLANDLLEGQNSQRIAEISKRAAAIPEGKPGDCEFCGSWSGRLVGGACAPCRDRYKLS